MRHKHRQPSGPQAQHQLPLGVPPSATGDLESRDAATFGLRSPVAGRVLDPLRIKNASARFRITLIDATTKVARDIYKEPDRLIGTVVLAPDGRRLYFTSAAIESDIWTMRFSR